MLPCCVAVVWHVTLACVLGRGAEQCWSPGSNKTDNEALNNSKTFALTFCALCAWLLGVSERPCKCFSWHIIELK